MPDIKCLTDYLTATVSDPVPKFILMKEILRYDLTSPEFVQAFHDMQGSKWYRQLVDEQWEDGSWGRFHTMDSKSGAKRVFKTTEDALRRARQLSLTKDDPVVARCIRLMERYIRGEETWRDNIEQHHDKGKSHLHSRPFATAAWLNLFDPHNPEVKPKRDIFVKTLKIATSKGYFDEEAWENENRAYAGPCLNGWNAFPLMIMQNAGCMEDDLQRKYLDYIWHRKGGIYYLTDFPLTDMRSLEDKRFYVWLGALECLSGFSLFPEFAKKDAMPHLLNEAYRLIKNEIAIPPAHTLRYAENWRDGNKRKSDLALRIARLIILCRSGISCSM